MKKFGGIHLTQLVLGIVLLSIIPVWQKVISPEILKMPENFSFNASVVSTDNFYNEESHEYEGVIFSKTTFTYETITASDNTLLINNVFDVRTPEDEKIFSVERLYSIDRYSGAHTTGGDKERNGYLFAPRNLTEGQEFTYWHINYDGPAKMKYVQKEEIFGLTVFHYETNYENTIIDQTANLGHLPGVGIDRGVILEPHLELWVEPVTGAIIDYQDETTAYFYDLASKEIINPWNTFSNTLNEESVQQNVTDARWTKTIQTTANNYIPIALAVIALILILSSVTNISEDKKRIIRKASFIALGFAVSTLAAIVLFGWALHNIELVKIASLKSTVNPITAICFFIVGITIALQTTITRNVNIANVLTLMIIAGARLLEIYGIIPTKINQLLFTDQVIATGSTMAIFTAISFLLMGIAIIASHIKALKRLYAVEITLIISALLSFLVVTGYLFAPLELLEIPLFLGTSLSTAVVMALTAIALLSVFRQQQKNQLSLAGNALLFSVLLFSIILTITLASTTERSFQNQAQIRFNGQVDETITKINDRVNIYINVLDGAKGLFAASESVERSEWKAYIGSLEIEKNYPGIQGIGYSVFIQPENLEQHIEEIRAQGFPDYTIRPEGERDIYSSIIYLEPFDIRNQQAFGYDMFQQSIRKAAMEQARDTAEARASGKITLVQEIDEDVQPGFLIYIPYYQNGKQSSTLSERRENIVGYTYSPFRARNFIEGIIGEEGIENIGLTVFDGITQDEESTLYSDHIQKINNSTPRFVKHHTLYVAGRPWTVTFESTADYGETFYSKVAPILIILAGIIVSLLISLTIFILLSSRQRAIVYAEKITENLRQSKAKDEAMLLSIADGLVATDEDGTIVLTNEPFESITGFSKEEVKNKKLSDILKIFDEKKQAVPSTQRPITKTLQSKKRIRNYTTKYLYKKKDGSLFPVAISVSPVILEGNVIGAVQVFRDISNEKEIDKAKSEFVSLASHQLRTPLSLINWYTEMLLDDNKKISKQQQEYLSEIYNGSQRMVALVNSLLNVSRIELGTFTVEPETINIRNVLTSVIKELTPIIHSKKIKVKTTIRRGVSKISADPKLFRIIIQNLLSNAVKYTPARGKVDVLVEKDNKNIRIAVSDNGIGIPKEQQSKIFSKLFRADNAKNSDTDGTGLGLYIIKSILEHSGGSIDFTSEEAKGTTFVVQLPETGMKKKEGSKSIN